MEKRKFSKEQIAILTKFCEERKYVIVSGINSYNEPFIVKARITHNDKNLPGIYDDKLVLEFGKEKDSPERKQTKWFGFYDLNIREQFINPDLIIQSIKDEEGNIIYQDNNFEEVKSKAVELAEKDKIENQYRKIKVCDTVTSELKKLIGHPITLDDTEGILVSCNHVTNMGDVIVRVMSGPLSGNCFVKSDSVLKTIDENDEEVIVAVNTLEENTECRHINMPSEKDLHDEMEQ